MGGHNHQQAKVNSTARPPDGRGLAVMSQRWENLLFLHWDLAAAVVQATLPPGLTVDTYGGRAWVGVVPFRMAAVRPRFLPPVPGLSWFWELNVRTYVRDRWGRAGVWFYSLDCDQPLACAVARRLFHLNYRDAHMSCVSQPDGGFDYRSCWRDGPSRARLRWRIGSGSPGPAAPGGLSHFLVERYRLYSFDRESGRLLTGEVAHEPYLISPAEVEALEVNDLFLSNGLPIPLTGPVHVVASRGVRVRVFSVSTTS
jgi:uncharacterized protein YqjF (DUF2071 family)